MFTAMLELLQRAAIEFNWQTYVISVIIAIVGWGLGNWYLDRKTYPYVWKCSLDEECNFTIRSSHEDALIKIRNSHEEFHKN